MKDIYLQLITTILYITVELSRFINTLYIYKFFLGMGVEIYG